MVFRCMKKRRRREKYAFSASQSTEFRFLAPAAGFSSTQPFSVKSSLQTRLMELLNRFLCMTFCLGKEKTQIFWHPERQSDGPEKIFWVYWID